jgi:uncharacterized protein (TIGR03546 family)
VVTLLKQFRKLFKVMMSETAPISIGLGLGIGVYLGLTPLLSGHTILLIALLMVFRINMSAAFCSMAIFKLLGMPLWATFHTLGASLLDNPSLSGLFTTLVNTPGTSLLSLNNSQVLGSLVVSTGLLPFVIVGGMLLTKWVRKVFTEQREEHWLSRMLLKSKIFAHAVKWATK